MKPKKIKLDALEVEAALRSEPRMMSFLEKYQPKDADYFIKHYAEDKVRWYEYGEFYVDWQSREETQWLDKGQEHLKVILQKKLFDKQCLWRAEQLKIEGIELCFDFTRWESRVLNCSFIDVSQEDIEAYQEYLLNKAEEAVELPWSSWQDYDEFKESDDDMPEWYQYHNLRTGGGQLLALTDVRGEKEDYYRQLYFDKKREEEAKSEKVAVPKPVVDPRPSLHYFDDEVIEEFVSSFEDPTTQKYFNAHLRRKNQRTSEDLEEILELLSGAEHFVPIEAHYDWAEGLRLAAAKYKAKMIAEHLPTVYTRYRTFRDMNIAMEEDNDMDFIRINYETQILGGREIAGEPRDFNF